MRVATDAVVAPSSRGRGRPRFRRPRLYVLCAMNSSRQRVVLSGLSALLATGAILAVALPRTGGGGKGGAHADRAGRAAPATTPTLRATAPQLQRPEPRPARKPAVSDPDQPVSIAGAARSVAAFMPGFLAWSVDRASASAIKNVTGGFRAQARSHPPRATPAEQRERLRVTRIRILAGDPPVAVVDLNPTAGVPYELDFYLVHTRGRWLISGLATPV